MGIQSSTGPPSPRRADSNYAQSLLSRFNLPSARQGLAAPAGDFYSLLSSAAGRLDTGRSREAQVEDLSQSGTLIPRGMTSASEKISFLSTQREKLTVLLSALDKEASQLGPEMAIEKDVDKRMGGAQLSEGLHAGLGDALKKSKSEAEFDEIRKDEVTGNGKASSWIWGWGGKAQAKSSGVDTT